MSTRQRAIALYRSILRTARTWEGPQEECVYIRQEAKAHFSKNKHLSSPAEIEQKLKEGQDRLDIGIHYKIPYPRMQHAPQFKRRDYQDIPIIR